MMHDDNRWGALAVLFLARFAMAFQFQAVGALSEVLRGGVVSSFFSLGLLIGLFMVPGVVLAFPFGVLAQRYGDQLISVCGLSLLLLGAVGFELSTSFPGAALARVVAGAGGVLISISTAKLVADWFEERQVANAMGILLSSWPAGTGAALLLLPWVAAEFSVTTALTLPVALNVAALVGFGCVYRSSAGQAGSPGSFRIQLSRREWSLCILAGTIWMFYNVAFVVVLSFGPAFLVSEGVSFPDAGFDVSLLSWALLFSLPLGGFILAQVERPTHILVLCFAGVAALIAAVTAGIAPAFALAAAGVLAGIPGGPLMKLPSEFLAGKNRSAGMGAFYTCYYLGMFALVPVAGIIRDVSARPAAPLLFAVGCALAAAATLVGFRVAMRGRVP